MSKKVRLFLSTIAILIFSMVYVLHSTESVTSDWTHAVAQSSEVAFTINPALQEKLNLFEAAMDRTLYWQDVPGLSVAVVKDSQTVYLKNFGTKDLTTGEAIDDHTVYRLASLSKGFAPVLTGILVQEGHLHWDDRVVDYLPDFKLKSKRATEQLTLRHLLSHTTGLPRHTYSNLLDEEVPYKTIRQKLSGVQLAHSVGKVYNYQNVVYSVIGDVIQAATGRSYQELLAEKIFAPLGMHTASTGYEAMALGDNVAYPHERAKHDYQRLPLTDRYYSVVPAAGVNASIQDMAQWLQLMLGQRSDVLADSTLQEICTPQVAVSPKERVVRNWRPVQRAAYGLGWRIVDKAGRRFVYHGGFVNGYRTEIGLCPEEGIGIVVLSNGDNAATGSCLRTFFDIYFANDRP